MDRLEKLERRLASLENESARLNRNIQLVRDELNAVKGVDSEVVSAQVFDETADLRMNPSITQSRNEQVVKRPQQRKVQRPVREHAQQERTVPLEQLIGRNAMGIGASILIFVAMIMFATLLLPYLGQEVKMVSMYLFSILLIGFGEFIYRKQKNSYLILSACGVGALFISIVATNVYFHFISGIPLYLLLILWMGFVSYLGKKRNFLFVIVGQIGIFMSMLIAYFGMASELDISLTFLFLLFSEMLYVGLFLNEAYKFTFVNVIGTFVSFVVAAFSVFAKSGSMFLFTTDFIYYGLVFCMLLCIFCLVYKSKTRLELALSFVISVVNGLHVLFLCFYINDFYIESWPISYVYLMLSFYYLVIFGLFILKNKQTDFDTTLFAYLSFGCLCLTMLCFGDISFMLLAVLFMSVVIASFCLSNKKSIYYFSQCILSFSILSLSFAQLFDLVHSANMISVPCDILFIATIAQMIFYRMKFKENRLFGYELFSYITLLLLIIVLVRDIDTLFGFDAGCISLLLFVLVQIAVKKVKWAYRSFDGIQPTHIINAILMVLYINVLFWLNFSEEIFLISLLLLLVLFSINIKNLLLINANFGVYIAIKYSVFIWLVLNKFYVENQFFSIAFLIVAIVCIIVGFLIQNKSIRLYGLILSITSVIKLILIDINYDNTLMRAVSFLICGILCFGISLIYNTIDKREKERLQKAEEANEIEE